MKKLRRLFSRRNAGGYTLVEVIVATALLGILVIGITAFVTPVFSVLSSSEEEKKAERSVATMEHYLSKSLRSAIYIKVFTNADLDDMNTGTDGTVATDPDFKTMIEFFDVDGREDKYTLNCIAIRYVTDNNIRNSKSGDTAQKYMLFHEKYDLNYKTMDSDDEALIFQECFYEDIYPTFDVGYIKVEVDEDGNVVKSTLNGDVILDDDETADTSDTSDTAEAASDNLKLTPAVTIDVNIYNDQDITNKMNLVFTGRSIIEVNNVKSMIINKDEKYKIFEPTDLSSDATADGKDIFIFYITRNTSTAVAGT